MSNRTRLCSSAFLFLLITALFGFGAQSRFHIWAVDPGDSGQTGLLAEKELRRAIEEVGDQVGDVKSADRRVRFTLEENGKPAEGYRISTHQEGDAVDIACSGNDRRGLLYAAYDLSESVRHREPLEKRDASEAPYCTYRQIVACSCDHDFYAQLIRVMPRWRMNALLLYSAYHQPDRFGPDGNFDRQWFGTYLTLPIAYRKHPKVRAMIESSPDFRHVRESFPRLLKIAREYGIDVSLKFQILSYTRVDSSGGHYREGRNHIREDFPHLFPGGVERPDWNSQVTYDFVREQLEELFTMYPDLAGITAASDEMSSFNIGHVLSPGTPEERRAWTRRLVETVEEVCTRFGKRCYWDLHGSGKTFLNALVEFGKDRPGGLRLRAESVPCEQVFSDKFASYPFEKVAAAGDGMCDHDIHMEGMQDFPWLPNIIDRYIVRHTRAGIKAGLRGGGAMWYIYRPHYSPVNDLSQINMELLSRLLWNPDESLDRIWNRWLNRRFGRTGAQAASHLLRSAHPVLNDILYFNNTNATFWFQYGFPKNLAWLMRPTWGQLIEYFQPPGTPLYAHPFSAVNKERAIPISQMREEKRRAVSQAGELLRYLESHKRDFDGGDYRTLLPRYVALLYYARAAEQLVEALYNFTNLHIRAYDPACKNPRQGIERAVQNLGKIYDEMQEDERLLLLERDVYYRGLKPSFLDNIPTLIADLKLHDRVLSEPDFAVSGIPEGQRENARRILDYARQIRVKFESNLRRETPEEELWARTLGDR